jgi:DNA-binding IclR family transcriptional regulator
MQRTTRALRPAPGETPAAAGKEPSVLFNRSVAKALGLLAAFGPERRSMNLPEMAAAADLTKSAAQRLAYTLEALGYLRKDQVSKRYAPTPRLAELGMRYTTTSPLLESASPYLLDLNIKCGETVYLSEPDGTDMVFVVSLPGHRQLSVQLPVGGRYPMYCTAAGRAYLSGLAQEEAARVVAASRLRAYTPLTVVDPGEIEAMIAAARETGYAFARGEYFRGDINIAAPVHGIDGRPIAAVGISVPVTRWSFEDACAQLGPLVGDVAQTISAPLPSKRP